MAYPSGKSITIQTHRFRFFGGVNQTGCKMKRLEKNSEIGWWTLVDTEALTSVNNIHQTSTDNQIAKGFHPRWFVTPVTDEYYQ